MNLQTELLLSEVTNHLRRGIYNIIDQAENSFYINTLDVICDIKNIVKKNISDHVKVVEIASVINKYEEHLNMHSSHLS